MPSSQQIHSFSPPSSTQNSRVLSANNSINAKKSTVRFVSSQVDVASTTVNGVASSSQNGEEDISMVEDDDEGAESEEESTERVPLHLEVRLLPKSTARFDQIKRILANYLESEYDTLLTSSELLDWNDERTLKENVSKIWIAECSLPEKAVPLTSIELFIHVYQPPASASITEFSTNTNEEEGEEDVMAASVLELPSTSLEGIWDSLIYEGDIKEKLLGYIYSTLLFSDASVDFNIVSWNRVVLLHGPPGTGKTSLCRALAQKLAIRLSDRYDHGKLIEINSHSLFSKWFSESGKLVQKLFAAVTEMVEDESGFVVVLIDEVESLTAARAGAMSGKEPSDALRVVNALLTQLDKLKHRKNCLVMTTSNLSAAIDGAFIDRADIKQYIGLPPPEAVYWILQSCMKEITRAGLIAPCTLYDYKTLEMMIACPSDEPDADFKNSSLLYSIAKSCHTMEMSGRTLRRLPVLSHARHLGMTSTSTASIPVKMWKWLKAMEKCVLEEGEQMEKIDKGS